MVMHKNSFSFDNSVGVIVHSNFVYLTDFRGIFMFSTIFFLKNVVISSNNLSKIQKVGWVLKLDKLCQKINCQL